MQIKEYTNFNVGEATQNLADIFGGRHQQLDAERKEHPYNKKGNTIQMCTAYRMSTNPLPAMVKTPTVFSAFPLVRSLHKRPATQTQRIDQTFIIFYSLIFNLIPQSCWASKRVGL